MFYNIAISGGGINTIAFIGCLQYLEEHDNYTKNIHNFLGASGGSIMCLFLILNYNSQEISDFLKSQIPKLNNFSIWNIFKIFSQYGFNNGKNVIDLIENILIFKGVSPNISLLELTKMTGKNLIISTTNVSSKKIEYISVDNYPNIQVVTAIRMSTAIPIFFTPVKYYNDYYVDSMVFNNFPIVFFDNFKNETLGLNILSKNTKNEIKCFGDFISFLCDCMSLSYYKHTNTNHKYVCNIVLDNATRNIDVTKFRFDFSDDKMNELIKLGYNSLKVFFDKSD
jgi:predicted acylesterase/phospholipase RssA